MNSQLDVVSERRALTPVGSLGMRRLGLRAEVYQEIMRMILEGELVEHEPLRIESLAASMAVSPTPIREALVQLELTGLVEYLVNKGYRVAPALNADDMRSIMDARLVLEVAAVRGAAQRFVADFSADLHELVSAQRATAKRIGSVPNRDLLREYLRLDHAFHELIFRECGNPFLAQLARSMNPQAQRTKQSFLHGIADASEAVNEHEQIADAIGAGDADAAETCMRSHLERVLSTALRQNFSTEKATIERGVA